jgi:hypothetical protein
LVGEIGVAFGNLELFVEGGICQLLAGNDKNGQQLAQALTAEMSFDRKVHAFASLYRLRVKAEKAGKDLDILVRALFKAQEDRNALLHSAWIHSEVLRCFTHTKGSAKASRGLVRHLHRVAPDGLLAIQERI